MSYRNELDGVLYILDTVDIPITRDNLVVTFVHDTVMVTE